MGTGARRSTSRFAPGSEPGNWLVSFRNSTRTMAMCSQHAVCMIPRRWPTATSNVPIAGYVRICGMSPRVDATANEPAVTTATVCEAGNARHARAPQAGATAVIRAVAQREPRRPVGSRTEPRAAKATAAIANTNSQAERPRRRNQLCDNQSSQLSQRNRNARNEAHCSDRSPTSDSSEKSDRPTAGPRRDSISRGTIRWSTPRPLAPRWPSVWRRSASSPLPTCSTPTRNELPIS